MIRSECTPGVHVVAPPPYGPGVVWGGSRRGDDDRIIVERDNGMHPEMFKAQELWKEEENVNE
jgi:hypothetical protein